MLDSAGAAAVIPLTNRAGATPLHLALGGGSSDVTAAELLIQVRAQLSREIVTWLQ